MTGISTTATMTIFRVGSFLSRLDVVADSSSLDLFALCPFVV